MTNIIKDNKHRYELFFAIIGFFNINFFTTSTQNVTKILDFTPGH